MTSLNPAPLFTPAEDQEFISLLKKVQNNNYWVPNLAVWREVQRTFSRWAVELVIVNSYNRRVPRILLCRYHDQGIIQHQGLWHIPGGFERFPESIAQTCSRIAQQELNVDVIYKGVLGIHKWTAQESPFGSRLLSLYVACQPSGELKLNEERNFFTSQEILSFGPRDMFFNHPHKIFLDQFLAKVESGVNVEPLTLGL